MSLRSKGPWKVDPNNPRFILGTEDKAVAKVFWEHDRHLVAAAPLLLDALTMCLGYLEAEANPNTDFIKIIKYAVAKAEGRK